MANNDQSNLAALLARVRAGDETAFEELHRAYRPLLRAEVGRYVALVGHSEAEDLGQEADLALYRAAITYCEGKGGAGFGAYAKTCVSNALCSEARKLRARRSTLSDAEAEDIPSDEDLAALAADAQAVAAIDACINAVLSPYEKRVWQLHLAKYRTGEIAKALGKDPRSIENALYRIKRKLQKALTR